MGLINQAIENNQDDFKILKKHYGERFAKLCRTLFPTILEEKGALSRIILAKFAPSKFLYEDIILSYATERFKNFIYGIFTQQENKELGIDETPEQLFDRAGYTLYKCETDEDVHKFEKYFANTEKLCTFKDPNRINTHTIFFAVKKNVDEIKRENFKIPRRQDEYGTSVISVQFTKGPKSTLSIKNRYNHTVDNPDATFSNDLENIYPGLTESFWKHYGIVQVAGNHNFSLPNYVMGNDGKYYRYNYEIDNVYYCINNVIITNGNPQYYDSRRYDLIDYFLIDKQKKTISLCGPYIQDGLVETFNEEENRVIKKIEVSKTDEGKIFSLSLGNNSVVDIVLDKYNKILEYHDLSVKIIPNCFMSYNTQLNVFEAPSATIIKSEVLSNNRKLKALDFPKLVEIGTYFLHQNVDFENLFAPNLEEIGVSGFQCARNIKNLSLPSLKHMQSSCFSSTVNLISLYLPKIETMGALCFSSASKLESFNAPLLTYMARNCFTENRKLKKIDLPNLENMEQSCFSANNIIEEIYLPKLKIMGAYAFNSVRSIKKLYFPLLETMGQRNFFTCTELEEVSAPNLVSICDNCFLNSTKLRKFNAPKVELTDYIKSYLKTNSKINKVISFLQK